MGKIIDFTSPFSTITSIRYSSLVYIQSHKQSEQIATDIFMSEIFLSNII